MGSSSQVIPPPPPGFQLDPGSGGIPPPPPGFALDNPSQLNSQLNSVPGMAKLGGVPPAAGQPPSSSASRALTGQSEPDNFITSPNGLIRTGARKIVDAAGNLAAGHKAEAVKNAIEGTGEALAPVGLGAIAPMIATEGLGATAGAIAGGAASGVAAREGGEFLSRIAGADPDTSDAIGDIASLPAAVLGSRLGSYLTDPAILSDPGVQEAIKGLVPSKIRNIFNAVHAAKQASAVADQPQSWITPARDAMSPQNAPDTLTPPTRVTPARALPPGAFVPPSPPDTSGVTVTTGEPLSYPGPRQLTAPQPGPTQNLRPPLRLGPGPVVTPSPADATNVKVTTGEPLSYPGPRQLAAPKSSAQALGQAVINQTMPVAEDTGGSMPNPSGSPVPASSNVPARSVPWPARYDSHASPANAYAIDQKLAQAAQQSGIKSRSDLTLEKVNALRKEVNPKSRPLLPKDTSRINDLWQTIQGQ
jgi:hypothetical protein